MVLGMKRLTGLAVLVVAAGIVCGPPAVARLADEACSYPAEVLDLANWKLTLPTGDDGDPDEIKQPDLAEFVADPWFVPTPECDGVRFRAAVDGVTTGGSKYPRAELREMGEDGDEAAWSTTEGTHTLDVELAFTSLPEGKPHVVGAQVHGGDDDVTVFRLEGTSLYVTDGDESQHHLITDDYQLGTRFHAKFVAADGEITAYYNGEPQTTLESDADEAYFKTGAYTQANCDNADPCDPDNYGEAIVYEVTVNHEEG